MSSPAISVIVPVYQTAQFLDKCLSSIARSTLSDIEVPIIDDGSDDDRCGFADFLRNRPDVRSTARDAGFCANINTLTYDRNIFLSEKFE
jgi:glycosyltransferase involved in cell wall biosynthesis